jgi:hypothetical protein
VSVPRRAVLRADGAASRLPLVAGTSSAPSRTTDGSWTVVALPDTQYYANNERRYRFAVEQTDWIAANVDDENIAFVTHEGDLIQEGDIAEQWDRMDRAMATLTVETVDEGSGGSVHRLLRGWSESDTWASLDGGIAADGSGATADYETKTGTVSTGQTTIDVTAGVRAWVGGEPNRGLTILPLGDDGWDFSTAEGETLPRLTVVFEPEESSNDQEDSDDSGDVVAVLDVDGPNGSADAPKQITLTLDRSAANASGDDVDGL